MTPVTAHGVTRLLCEDLARRSGRIVGADLRRRRGAEGTFGGGRLVDRPRKAEEAVGCLGPGARQFGSSASFDRKLAQRFSSAARGSLLAARQIRRRLRNLPHVGVAGRLDADKRDGADATIAERDKADIPRAPSSIFTGTLISGTS